jgi:hypothetical protein
MGRLDLAGTAQPVTVAVGTSSGTTGVAMIEGNTYVVISTVAAWLQPGGTAAVVGAATAIYIPPNYPIELKAGPATGTPTIIGAVAGQATISIEAVW